MILLITTDPSTCSGKISNNMLSIKLIIPSSYFTKVSLLALLILWPFLKATYTYLEFEMDREELGFFCFYLNQKRNKIKGRILMDKSNYSS